MSLPRTVPSSKMHLTPLVTATHTTTTTSVSTTQISSQTDEKKSKETAVKRAQKVLEIISSDKPNMNTVMDYLCQPHAAENKELQLINQQIIKKVQNHLLKIFTNEIETTEIFSTTTLIIDSIKDTFPELKSLLFYAYIIRAYAYLLYDYVIRAYDLSLAGIPKTDLAKKDIHSAEKLEVEINDANEHLDIATLKTLIHDRESEDEELALMSELSQINKEIGIVEEKKAITQEDKLALNSKKDKEEQELNKKESDLEIEKEELDNLDQAIIGARFYYALGSQTVLNILAHRTDSLEVEGCNYNLMACLLNEANSLLKKLNKISTLEKRHTKYRFREKLIEDLILKSQFSCLELSVLRLEILGKMTVTDETISRAKHITDNGRRIGLNIRDKILLNNEDSAFTCTYMLGNLYLNAYKTIKKPPLLEEAKKYFGNAERITSAPAFALQLKTLHLELLEIEFSESKSLKIEQFKNFLSTFDPTKNDLTTLDYEDSYLKKKFLNDTINVYAEIIETTTRIAYKIKPQKNDLLIYQLIFIAKASKVMLDLALKSLNIALPTPNPIEQNLEGLFHVRKDLQKDLYKNLDYDVLKRVAKMNSDKAFNAIKQNPPNFKLAITHLITIYEWDFSFDPDNAESKDETTEFIIAHILDLMAKKDFSTIVKVTDEIIDNLKPRICMCAQLEPFLSAVQKLRTYSTLLFSDDIQKTTAEYKMIEYLPLKDSLCTNIVTKQTLKQIFDDRIEDQKLMGTKTDIQSTLKFKHKRQIQFAEFETNYRLMKLANLQHNETKNKIKTQALPKSNLKIAKSTVRKDNKESAVYNVKLPGDLTPEMMQSILDKVLDDQDFFYSEDKDITPIPNLIDIDSIILTPAPKKITPTNDLELEIQFMIEEIRLAYESDQENKDTIANISLSSIKSLITQLKEAYEAKSEDATDIAIHCKEILIEYFANLSALQIITIVKNAADFTTQSLKNISPKDKSLKEILLLSYETASWASILQSPIDIESAKSNFAKAKNFKIRNTSLTILDLEKLNNHISRGTRYLKNPTLLHQQNLRISYLFMDSLLWHKHRKETNDHKQLDRLLSDSLKYSKKFDNLITLQTEKLETSDTNTQLYIKDNIRQIRLDIISMAVLRTEALIRKIKLTQIENSDELNKLKEFKTQALDYQALLEEPLTEETKLSHFWYHYTRGEIHRAIYNHTSDIADKKSADKCYNAAIQNLLSSPKSKNTVITNAYLVALSIASYDIITLKPKYYATSLHIQTFDGIFNALNKITSPEYCKQIDIPQLNFNALNQTKTLVIEIQALLLKIAESGLQENEFDKVFSLTSRLFTATQKIIIVLKDHLEYPIENDDPLIHNLVTAWKLRATAFNELAKYYTPCLDSPEYKSLEEAASITTLTDFAATYKIDLSQYITLKSSATPESKIESKTSQATSSLSVSTLPKPSNSYRKNSKKKSSNVNSAPHTSSSTSTNSEPSKSIEEIQKEQAEAKEKYNQLKKDADAKLNTIEDMIKQNKFSEAFGNFSPLFDLCKKSLSIAEQMIIDRSDIQLIQMKTAHNLAKYYENRENLPEAINQIKKGIEFANNSTSKNITDYLAILEERLANYQKKKTEKIKLAQPSQPKANPKQQDDALEKALEQAKQDALKRAKDEADALAAADALSDNDELEDESISETKSTPDTTRTEPESTANNHSRRKETAKEKAARQAKKAGEDQERSEATANNAKKEINRLKAIYAEKAAQKAKEKKQTTQQNPASANETPSTPAPLSQNKSKYKKLVLDSKPDSTVAQPTKKQEDTPKSIPNKVDLNPNINSTIVQPQKAQTTSESILINIQALNKNLQSTSTQPKKEQTPKNNALNEAKKSASPPDAPTSKVINDEGTRAFLFSLISKEELNSIATLTKEVKTETGYITFSCGSFPAKLLMYILNSNKSLAKKFGAHDIDLFAMPDTSPEAKCTSYEALNSFLKNKKLLNQPFDLKVSNPHYSHFNNKAKPNSKLNRSVDFSTQGPSYDQTPKMIPSTDQCFIFSDKKSDNPNDISFEYEDHKFMIFIKKNDHFFEDCARGVFALYEIPNPENIPEAKKTEKNKHRQK